MSRHHDAGPQRRSYSTTRIGCHGLGRGQSVPQRVMPAKSAYGGTNRR